MRRTWLIFSQAVTVALALLFVVATLKPEWLQRRGDAPAPAVVSLSQAPAPAASAPATATPALSYRAAVQRAAPTVVSITSRKAVRPEDEQLQFFGLRLRRPDGPPQVGIGSGVIVSPEGYLLTNNHVIEGADDIEVQLADGRDAQARIVGADPETDLAVLKVELADLPVISFGDSDALQVGDPVLAIGNPYGVGQTVTAGIVSALGRNQLGLNTFENFIQTDAAINPGNSGGALVDAGGHLLGINSAIFSRSGGSQGIGFAIPAKLARQVLEGLVRDGRVVRGWIGVETRDLTPELARALNLPVRDGVLISGVLQNGPAAGGGIRPGDVVVRVAERPVQNSSELREAVAALKPQQTAAIAVQRGDRTVTLNVIVAQRPDMRARQAR
jgi:Do/DeqQ family serine protease